MGQDASEYNEESTSKRATQPVETEAATNAMIDAEVESAILAAAVVEAKAQAEVEANVDAHLLAIGDTEAVCTPTSKLEVRDEREHLDLVFIGHVDAGKSTFCGQILYQTEQVDARTIEKYKKKRGEAKEKNRESWFLAIIMDTNEEERAKGEYSRGGASALRDPAETVHYSGRVRTQELRSKHDCWCVPS